MLLLFKRPFSYYHISRDVPIVLLFALILLIKVPICSYSQATPPVDTWTVYPSYNRINDITSDSTGQLWAASTGGVFAIDDTSVAASLTTLNGLYRPDIENMAYDSSRHFLLMGYIDGHIDVYDIENEDFEGLEDIKRADQYTSRGINDFFVHKGRLYVATDFGVVIYQLSSLLVEQTFAKLGSFQRGTTVNNLYLKDNLLYCATDQGLAFGNVNDDLLISDNWENYSSVTHFNENSLQSVAAYASRIFTSTGSSSYVFENGTWNQDKYFRRPVKQYLPNKRGSGNTLGGVSTSYVTMINLNLSRFPYQLFDYELTSLYWNQSLGDTVVWLGTQNNGVIKYDRKSQEVIKEIAPKGPQQNFFTGLSADDEGRVISGSARLGGFNAGYHLYDGTDWNFFTRFNNPVLDDGVFFNAWRTGMVGGRFYIGSWGRGVVRHNPENGEIAYFNNDNSSLVGTVTAKNVIITGIDADSDNKAWISLYNSENNLYFQETDDQDWQKVSRPSAASQSDYYSGLFIDSNNQKWIPVVNFDRIGTGLLVIKTNDLSTESDDESVKLTEDFNRGYLPDNQVNDIAEDKNGEIWIATGRGIARFTLPSFITRGNSNDIRAQWLINADTAASSPFLLRDINASSILVNDANQKWIGSRNNGLWLINAEGNRIVEHFTSENSPLLSDNIESLAMNHQTGTLYITTDNGLISYTDVPRKAAEKMKDLYIYPNPFSYSDPEASEIIIDNLGDETTIQIMGLDGRVINSIEARGGRITWNARDFNGNKVATGVYFAVALDEENDRRAFGKLVIVQ